MVAFGFIAIFGLTKNLSRHSGWYVLKMVLFVIYETILFVLLIVHYIQGINIRYGIEFGRKILVFDKNKNDYVYIYNDGTYMIEDG